MAAMQEEKLRFEIMKNRFYCDEKFLSVTLSYFFKAYF